MKKRISNKDLFDKILEIARLKKSLGESKVFRTSIYDILEYYFGRDAIFSGKALTRKLMEDVASAIGGTYIYDKGRARIVF
jgi:glycogen debranching enzyme